MYTSLQSIFCHSLSQDHLDVRSPSAKRAKIAETNQSSLPSQNPTKTVLEDISNYRDEIWSRDISDISATQVHIPLLGERKVYRRIPGRSSNFLKYVFLQDKLIFTIIYEVFIVKLCIQSFSFTRELGLLVDH